LGQKVAIYCRVSTNDQSCERQEIDLVKFAKRASYKVVGLFKETASGIKDSRAIRNEVIELARQRHITAILVTELTRWGRSTVDLVSTLQLLQSWNVSIIALNGLQYDLSTAHGKMIASVFASLAEFERDVIKERIKSGIAIAKSKGRQIGRAKGTYIKSHKLAKKVLEAANNRFSYRQIAKDFSISKNTVTSIMKRYKMQADDDENN